MKDNRLTNRVIKFAFIFLGSIGTILFIRWFVAPLVFSDGPPSLLRKSLTVGIGLFAFALIVAAASSGIAIVYCLLQALRTRAK